MEGRRVSKRTSKAVDYDLAQSKATALKKARRAVRATLREQGIIVEGPTIFAQIRTATENNTPDVAASLVLERNRKRPREEEQNDVEDPHARLQEHDLSGGSTRLVHPEEEELADEDELQNVLQHWPQPIRTTVKLGVICTRKAWHLIRTSRVCVASVVSAQIRAMCRYGVWRKDHCSVRHDAPYFICLNDLWCWHPQLHSLVVERRGLVFDEMENFRRVRLLNMRSSM